MSNSYDEFENVLIQGIHIRRYVASWTRYKSLKYSEIFEAWLRSLVINDEHLTDDEIRRIVNYAENGKLELQSSVKRFIDR